MRIFLLSFLVFLSVVPAMAQSLMEERIWKISTRKKSIFLDSGVFHLNSPVKSSSLSSIRSSAVAGRGYERVVLDFSTSSVPKIYGHISGQTQKISLDLYDTTAGTNQPQLKNSQFVKSIDFINVDGKTLTMELNLKNKASFDIFYLENPGRLVIDIR